MSIKRKLLKENRFLVREVVLLFFQTALLVMGNLSFASIFSGSLTIKGGFGLGFYLVYILEAKILSHLKSDEICKINICLDNGNCQLQN